jgi:ketosteroid isomerase-like protein
MSENVKKLSEAYEAFGRGDMEAAFKNLHEECTFRTGSDLTPSGGTYHGKQEIMGRWLPALGATFENLRLTVDETIGDGDTICVCGTTRAKVAGKDLKSPFAHIWHYRDGKVIDAMFLSHDANVFSAVQEREAAKAGAA